MVDEWLRFMETGGTILWVILGAAALMLTLLAERYWFVYLTFKGEAERWVKEWNARSDHSSWRAGQIRQQILSEARMEIGKMMPVIRALVAMMPLLGLLGTVLGMIELFDVIGATGSSNARAMAAGISMATISTMAGMVVALVGLFASGRLEYSGKIALQRFGDRLQEGNR